MEEAKKERQHKLLSCLVSLPKKIITLHSLDNVQEFILYDLSKKDCFNLNKAAYFVDNPDFNLIKGVAGFSQDELTSGWRDVWQEPDNFTDFMKNSVFNQQVRGIYKASLKRNNSSEDAMHEIAKELHLDRPLFFSWNMKHDNHGFLIYERSDSDEHIDQFLSEGFHILGLCPIF
jgi:hypothetical protein